MARHLLWTAAVVALLFCRVTEAFVVQQSPPCKLISSCNNEITTVRSLNAGGDASSLPTRPNTDGPRRRRCRMVTGTKVSTTNLCMSWTENQNEPTSVKRATINDRGANDNEEEEALSDVDARVLREMLQESKLDLSTEEDVRKLLDRGTKKKVPVVDTTKDNKTKQDSEFESSILQTLSDTKLWKALSAKADEVLESAKIWVGNEVERGLKTAAALGLFAWERAVRDVGRALPAAGTATKKIFLLANVSSFQEEEEAPNPVSAESLREELNRPADEIKSVSQAVWDILNGETSTQTGGGRGLKTVAKAGTANMADRQRRAFRQSRKKRQDEANIAKGISQIPGGIVDATYELQRELKSETNPAGYRTEPIRKAIEAGVTGTGNILEGIKESARLAAAERKAKRLQAAQEEEEAVAAAAAPVIEPETRAGDAAKATTTTTQTPKLYVDGPTTNVVNPEMPFSSFVSPPAQETSFVSPPDQETVSPPAQKTSPSVVDPATQIMEQRRADLLLDLQLEREAMLDRLLMCIRQPEDTWLTETLSASHKSELTEESLRDVATLMILLKDELNSTSSTVFAEETVETCLEQLRTDLRFVEQLRTSVASTISMTIGGALYDIIVGKYDVFGGEEPMLLQLDELERALEEPVAIPPPPPPPPPPKRVAETEPHTSASFFVDVAPAAKPEPGIVTKRIQNPEVYVGDVESDITDDTAVETTPVVAATAAVVDVVTEAVVPTQQQQAGSSVYMDDAAEVVVDSDTTSNTRTLAAEVVSDDDFDSAVGEARQVAAVSEGAEEEEAEPNLVVTAALRTLDVIFFVLEKAFVLVPRAVAIAGNAIKVVGEVNEGGKGKKGWEVIRNTADPKGRY